MYILTLRNKPDGVFSVLDDFGDHIIPIFEDESDAERYYFMIEEMDKYPEMQVFEIDEDVIVNACADRDQKYAIITPDDFLIPPEDLE